MRRVLLVILATAVGVSAATRLIATAQQTTEPPPADLAGISKRGGLFATSYPGVIGTVRYDMLAKEITVTWFRDFPDSTRQMSFQVEPLGFWPTEVCGLGRDVIGIAGKTIKNQTILKTWQFSPDEALEDAYTDPVTNQTVYPETYIPVQQTETVFSGNVAGKRLVRSMFFNHGSATSAFVQFQDSRDLYELDLASGASTLVLSAAVEPLLQQDYGDAFAKDHATRGYLYFFHMDVGANGGPESLVLVDSDRDGVLDLSATMHLVGSDAWKQAFADQSLFSDPLGG